MAQHSGAEHSGRIYLGIGGWTFEPWRGIFYPEGLPKTRELEYASAASHLDRDQRHLLPHPDARRPSASGRARRPTVSCSRSRDRATPPTGACWPRPATRSSASSKSGVDRARRPARADAVAVRADQEVRRGGFRRLPRAAAGEARRAHAAPRGRGAPPELRATPAFVALLREHGVAVVFAEHETYPAIADVTADFVYARLQKGEDTIPTAYPPDALDAWAGRVRTWPQEACRMTFRCVERERRLAATPRDVFAYSSTRARCARRPPRWR